MSDAGQAWLDRLAAPGPDPGGGAAAAVMLALGSALTQMVASYPARQQEEGEGEGEVEAGADLRVVVQSAAALRRRSVALVDADALASARLVAAWRAGAPDLREAAVAAARSSQEIIDVAAEAEPLLDVLTVHGDPRVLADVAVAAVAYAAAVRAAAVNLVGNLRLAAGPRATETVAGDSASNAAAVAAADALANRLDALASRVRRGQE